MWDRPWRASVVGLLVLGVLLRVLGLHTLSLWLDEGFTVLYARLPWRTVLGLDGFYSPHPPLFFALVKAVSQVTGELRAAREVSALASVGALAVFAVLARRLLPRAGARVAMGALVLSPLQIYLAQEGRMYALVALLVVSSWLALVDFFERPNGAAAAAYGVCGLTSMAVDYSSVFALAPQVVILGWIARVHGRRVWPLLVAIALAIVAYLPWVPHVLATVGSAGGDARRQDYLGLSVSRIGEVVLSVAGLAGDGQYFYGSASAVWHLLPWLAPLWVIALVGVVVACAKQPGVRVWAGGLFLGTVAVAAAFSLISPAFAERTVLSATFGWALVLGAAWERPRARPLVVLLGVATAFGTGAVVHGADKQDWRTAAATVADLSTLDLPLVTYSYAGVADVLVDVYQPGVLSRMTHLTVRDGALEATLSGDRLPRVGWTRDQVIAGALPLDADAVWVLFPNRAGQHELEEAIHAEGFTEVYRHTFEHPRNLIRLELYARDGVDLGAPVAVDLTTWTLPPTASRADDGVISLVSGHVAGDVPIGGAGLVFATAEIYGRGRLTVRCDAVDDGPSEVDKSRKGTRGVWSTHDTVVWCPAGTRRVTLRAEGKGVKVRTAGLRVLQIPSTAR